jgi:CHAD domain-containing protein
MIFGKDYSKELAVIDKCLAEQNANMKGILKVFNDTQDFLGKIQDNQIEMAKIQAQHKG